MIPDMAAYMAELSTVLPPDLPRRERVLDISARHLVRIAEINPYMNLTRVLEPREAAIKHVLDSVLPWRKVEGHSPVLDVGTGAGFPGIPLAAAFPAQKFVLCESIKKKAAFVRDTALALGLVNVEVTDERAEETLKGKTFSLTLARAVSPLPKFLRLLAPVIANCGTILLYKGPDAAAEVAEAEQELRKTRLEPTLSSYALPAEAGYRTLIELSRTLGRASPKRRPR